MFNFLVWILLIELIVLLFFIIMSLVENIYLTSRRNKEGIHHKVLTKLLMECLEKKTSPLPFAAPAIT